jgi:hypothetical protein
VRQAAFILFLTAAVTPASAQFAKYGRDYVPDAATAIAIGRAVSIPIYGQKVVDSEEPFTATRKNDLWTVFGSFGCPPEEVCVGGPVTVTLSAKDGRILSVIHTK